MNYNFLKSCTIVVIVSIFCVSTELRAQSNEKKVNVDETEFGMHKWEVGINIAPLLKLTQPSNFVYPYLIKLNMGKKNRRSALRFMVSPYLINVKDNPTPDSTSGTYFETRNTNFSPTAAIGYEWQRQFGRFSYYYGSDIAFRFRLNQGKSDNYLVGNERGKSIFKTSTTSFHISPLLGARYYLLPRVAVSLESQLQLIWAKEVDQSTFKGRLLYKNSTINKDIQLFPYYFLNISYHF